jgi:hypothetical protein
MSQIGVTLALSGKRRWASCQNLRSVVRLTCASAGPPVAATTFASRWSPPSSLFDGLGRAATRRTGEEQGTERSEPPRSGQDHRAISVQLARVTSGQSRTSPVAPPGWSAAPAAWIGRIPKLIVRVRFSSPAPQALAQVSMGNPGDLAMPRSQRPVHDQLPVYTWSSVPRTDTYMAPL